MQAGDDMSEQPKARSISYSTDGENFGFDSPSEALADMDFDGRLEVGATYEEGQFGRVDLSAYLQADSILEMAEERLYDDIGESSEDAFSADHEAVAELQDLLNEWAAKHLHKDCWQGVGMPITHTVTADDIADFRRLSCPT